MADHDYAIRAIRAFVDDFVPRVEQISQDSASTEAVLYATKYADEERANMRLELEFMREVECWQAIQRTIAERVSKREALLEGLRVRRREESETSA